MDTSPSLLDRLRGPGNDADWRRFDALYRPLIHLWLRRDANLGEEAEDLAQDILAVVFQELPGFQRVRTGSFRRWLLAVTLHRLKDYWRKRQHRPEALGGLPNESPLASLADGDELARHWDEEHDRHVVRRLMELAEAQFSATAVQAFRLVVYEEMKPVEAARVVGVSVNEVYLAKSRIQKWLRQEALGLLD